MGKYFQKSKTTSEVSLMEVSHHQSSLSLGVRTRAKTLALQRLGKLTPSDASYLQLRSRRLEKTKIVTESRRQRQQTAVSKPNPNLNSRVCSVKSESNCGKEEDGYQLEREIRQDNESKSTDLGIEASFGENLLEFEGRQRDTRETTPCSLIRDPVTVTTPGSTTKHANFTNPSQTSQNSMQRHIPTTHDMDDFFSSAEEQQQKQFVEKYNFDPLNDKPLHGRYEWVKVDP